MTDSQLSVSTRDRLDAALAVIEDLLLQKQKQLSIGGGLTATDQALPEKLCRLHAAAISALEAESALVLSAGEFASEADAIESELQALAAS